MIFGTGYVVRSTGTGVHNDLFTGIPTNEEINITTSVGTDATLGNMIDDNPVGVDDDQWNLIGNPYASAIGIDLFLNNATNNSLLERTIYFWAHNT